MKTRKICIDAQTGFFSNVNRDCVVFYWSSNSRYWYQSIKRMTFICFISFLSLSTFAHIDVELFHVNDAIDVSSNAILQDYNLPDGFSFISGSFFPIHSHDIHRGDIIHLYSCSDSHAEYSDTVMLTEKGGKIKLPNDFEGGAYQVYIQREDKTQELGMVNLLKESKMPKPSRVIAHRGWHTKGDGTSQNSRASIRNAFEAGFYGCETDVHQTIDGYLVVNHDFTIKGVTINTSTYDMVKDKTLSNGEKVPLLTDFFNIMKNEYPDSPTKLVIELKVNENTDTIRLVNSVVNAVREADLTSRVEYISFCLEACIQIVELDSTATVSLLTHIDPYKVKRYNLTGIDYDYRAFFSHPTWLSEAENNGLYINAWTVDDNETILQFNNMGVDFITTNNPGFAQDVYDFYKDMMPECDIVCQIDDDVASFNGTSMLFPEDYVALVKESCPTYVNLSNVNVSKEITYDVLCDGMQLNTLYELPVNFPVKGNNIIKNGTCKSLVLVDKLPLNVATTFTAENVSYEREMAKEEWGMVCLPFILISNDSVQYYNLFSVNEDVVIFAPVDFIQAGIPCLFHKKHLGNLRITFSEPTTIESEKELVVENFILKGVMKDYQTIASEDNDYHFSKGKFWTCDGDDITIHPFSAYLMAETSTFPSFFVNTTDNLLVINKMLGESGGIVLSIYDGKGFKIKKLQQGLNIVRYNDGRTRKVIY